MIPLAAPRSPETAIAPNGSRSVEPSAGTSPLPADPYPRRRDRLGNRLPYSYTHSLSVVEDIPLEETPLAVTIREVERYASAAAGVLRHFYDHRLRPAIGRVRAVCAEEEARLERRITQTIHTNEALETDLARLRGELDAVRTSLHSEDASFIVDLDRASSAVIEAVAAAGGQYDPHRQPLPGEPDRSRNPEVVSWKVRQPLAGGGHDSMPELLGWMATALVGVMIGVSLGTLSGSLYVDSLFRDVQSLLFWLAIGMGPALLGKFAIRYFHHRAAEVSYFAAPVGERLLTISAALVFDAAILGIDALIQQKGMLAALVSQSPILPSASNPAPGTAEEVLFLLAAMLVTLGYVAVAAWEGNRQGRRGPIDACIAAEMPPLSIHGITHFDTPEARVALAAIGTEDALKVRRGAARQAREREIATLEGQIAARASELRPVNVELSERGLQRIQDALDDLAGAQKQWDYLLAVNLARLPEGNSALWVKDASSRAMCGAPSWVQRWLWRLRRRAD